MADSNAARSIHKTRGSAIRSGHRFLSDNLKLQTNKSTLTTGPNIGDHFTVKVFESAVGTRT